ncbi:siderophore-interacting protein [Nannocystis pusilla]|uniref:SIP domain-containing protein n=1 Tax=Nannocystis pusilla TaxID=889268 RepID=A0ABS7TLU2_9BACT|nr:SIP domain-containing protein [Nannocystis pusilla]MBZ5709193.1 SIP domain-containing protein [Nannocystis pusilla]
MASGKGILLGALGGLLLRDATVRAICDVASSFRGVELVGPGLRGVTFHPGDKLQMLLPSRDVRTFTPLRWDAEAGATELLVYHHAASPAGEWIRGLAVGDPCRFVGPQRSIRLPEAGPVVLFGDETSAAVARAFAAAANGRALVCVFETGAEDDLRSALGADVSRAILVRRRADEEHLPELVDQLQAELTREPGASLVLTGRAQAIQKVRAGLKARALPRPIANKAYWSLGKIGLD